MRIAVVQMHYPIGHRRLDQEYMRILSQVHELVIVDDGKYFPKGFCDKIGVEHITVHPIMVKRWERFKRFLHYINLISVFVSLKINRKDYDVILFLNIHSALYFVSRWLPKKKVILFHHQDIDDMLAYSMYSKQFQKVKNNFTHICLAEFISEGLVKETAVKSDNVYTVYQPQVFLLNKNRIVGNKENLLIGIGNSTDEDVINALILYDKNASEKCNNRVIMRSKVQEYEGKVLSVIKGYLSREDYESLYSRSKVSIVTYPKRYRLRYSGIIDDSLATGLVVFANDNPCSRYFASRYPNNVLIFKSSEELWEMLQLRLPQCDNKEFDLFMSNHSDDHISLQLNAALNA